MYIYLIITQNNYYIISFYRGVNPHDIAVLRLASALTLSASVSPIGLPVAGAQPSGNAILSGWGATNAAGNAMPNHLQTVTKPIITLAGTFTIDYRYYILCKCVNIYPTTYSFRMFKCLNGSSR